MKFKIHFEINGYEDSFIIEEENIDDIKLTVKEEIDRRGLTEQDNNLWSEEI